MANKRVFDVPELTTPPDSVDFINVIDISDLTESGEGTLKKVKIENLIPVEDYSLVVYVNNNNPNAATIFDDVTPPTTNDNAFKSDVDNLYIGLDSSVWIWNGSAYTTKSVNKFSNFYLSGTSADAGSNKASAISRTGTIKAPKFISDGKTSSDVVLGTGDTSTLKTINGNVILGSGDIVISGGSGATDLAYTPSPTNGIVTSSTGTDATIPLADGTNAGLLKPAKYTVLENTSGTNTGDQDLSGKADLVSPTFTGIPVVPTATAGTNTTQAASTAFVLENATLKPIQVTAQTLTEASWTLVSGLYEYDLSNANITTISIVDVIPDNAYINVIKTAEVLPKTLSGSGTVKLYATNLPSGNIIVTINIWK